MHAPDWTPAAAGDTLRRLFVYNGGFLTQRRVRRILQLAGYDISLGKPSEGDLVGVWGQSPTSPRGEAVAARTDTPVIRVEDAFLRSIHPGRDGEPPLGLCIDDLGIHFDPERPSRLERILAEHPLDDTALLNRARAGIERVRGNELSKYNAFDVTLPAPEPGYVLVIDQTAGDASVTASRANRHTFQEMLFQAREDHPNARILIKTHPETAAGHRGGHFHPDDCRDGMELYDAPVSPWTLLDGAIAVYTVSSQLGFEAILAGHRPHVFGQPFYAGWGLTDDHTPLYRRQRRLTRAQLFAAAMILYPIWFDPYRDRLCSFEDALTTLEAEVRAYREDGQGWVAAGMRLWKRGPLQKAFGLHKPLIFNSKTPVPAAQKSGRPLMVWAGKTTPNLDTAGAVRVEDGFIRSRGLGAALTPPLSLVLDDQGIYYDPSHPSRLDAIINTTALSDDLRRRAEALVARLTSDAFSKYNLDRSTLPNDLPTGRRILVPGQVEDDASIRLGAGDINTNRALLSAVRAANPDAVIFYKPHPDVEAGLRIGQVPDAKDIADVVLSGIDAVTAIEAVDEVWTMTSTLGFEALLRGRRVVTFGQPFYASWGLTQDRGMPVAHRIARPDLGTFVHCCLIDYPRYFDPVTGRPCPVEVALDRIKDDTVTTSNAGLRALSKLQGLLASYAHLWR
ncbi:MAG: capsular polysaccharide biosynthesis protein [Marivivens sp.]|uniref:capsular polysaccharide biosynthesis protein n=1 Tax=Marivivens sp. TaxID=1978374 RepID=UPI0018210CAB|nr:capsular polysaccharide biosynthesis protein [Marivivens sp.]NVJ95135.1 capsular polysaccharide biosynthesis protein [Marivivens sp.]